MSDVGYIMSAGPALFVLMCIRTRVTTRSAPFRFTLLVKTLLRFRRLSELSYRQLLIRQLCSAVPSEIGIAKLTPLSALRCLMAWRNVVL